jgi:D-glycero-D-manno-heptose 1,7-bisphosphate phosphatase
VDKKSALSPAVFFDRDGTLIRDVHYINDPAKVELFPDTLDSLRRLKAAGFRIVVVTNQSGFARGIVTQAQYDAVHARMLELTGPENIDGTYYCPDFGPRRKPSPTMLQEAASDLQIDLTRSAMIGDKASDIESGKNAGTKTIFIKTGHPLDAPCEPDFIAENLAQATDWVLGEMGLAPT